MTENEAIEELKMIKHTRVFLPSDEVYEMAIQALEEIQSYRAIGTVEELKEYEPLGKPKEIEVMVKRLNTVLLEQHDKLAEYAKIGTVEEIKSFFNDNRKAGYKHGYSDGYNKAIDEFVLALKLKYPYFVEDVGFVEANKMLGICIDEIAEQMKDGAE